MRSLVVHICAAVWLLLAAGAGCMTAKARYPANFKPPSPPPLARPADPKGDPPGPQYAWIDGYYEWDATSKDWVWRRGRWARRPYPDAKWIAGRWTLKDGDMVWVPGHWKRP